MKETKITKRIFAVFVAFIVILLISCGDLQVFADSIHILWNPSSSAEILSVAVCILDYDGNGVFSQRYYFEHSNFATDFDIDFDFVTGHYYKIAVGRYIRYRSSGNYASEYYLPSVNESLTSNYKQTNIISFNEVIDSDVFSLSLSSWVGVIYTSSSSGSVLPYYFTFDHAGDYFYNFYYVYSSATPTPTPTPDLSYLLPNSDISLYSLTLDNFNNNVDPVAISSSSFTSSHIYAFSAPDVEIYGCFVNDKFYYFTKDDRVVSSSVGIAESDFMDRLVSIHVSDSLIPYPLTSVKYGYFSDYTFTAAEKNSSFITFSSFAEAVSFYDTYIIEPTYTPEPPTASPEPSWNPEQPTYYTFFNHLLNDGNNALNALYLSWTSANNKFYTGIFFIGLPILIGIFGIVASIFFGGDD